MKNTWFMAVLGAAVLGLGTTAQAIPSVSGSISFTGGSTVDSGTDLSTATAFTGYSSLQVLAGTAAGSYAPLNGGGSFNGVSFSTFSFGGNVLSPNPLVHLWSVTDGATVYSFDATSVHIDTQN